MLLRVLESCIVSRDLILGQIIHQHLLKRSLTLTSATVHLKLTRFYISCNELKLARHLFNEIRHSRTDPILWDLMIRAYASNDFPERALDLYYKMLHSGVRPTKFTYPFAHKACTTLRAIEDGKLIHSHVKCSDFSADMYVCTALVDFYGKCGQLDMALQVFDEMPKRDIVAWNAMISGVALHGRLIDVIELFLDMRRSDRLSPNLSTIVGILPALGKAGALRELKSVHGYCTRMGFSNDIVVKTGILDIYGKSKCIIYAKRVFDSVSLKNEVTWSAMIGGYIENEMIKEAREVFLQMLAVGILTPVAIGLILMGCTKFGDFNGGRCIQCYAIKAGLILDLTIGNTLISLYAKHGSLCDAFKQFNEIGRKDVVSYNSLISGCVENCRPKESLLLFHDMKSFGIQPDLTTLVSVLPACSNLAVLRHGSSFHGYCVVHGYAVNTTICNALMDMYSKCGKLHVAKRVFDTIHKRDIVSWNTMMFGYGIHGFGEEALCLFNSMQDTGLKPDDVTFLALLSACSHSKLVNEGKQVFNFMTQDFNISPRMDHYNGMTDVLARAGFLEEAYDFVNKMPFAPDVRVWCTLLSACWTYKNVEVGDKVSKKMESLGFDETGSLVLLYNAYSAAERWDDAENIRMIKKKIGFYKNPGYSWTDINQ